MKNRKYNLFVLILSLIVSLFASCSNGMNIEEPQMAKITFTFEDPFFQNLFGSKNNSRMVSLKTGNNYFSWATIKNSETKEIVTEGMYLNEIPYGSYDITYEIFYFTDEEVSNFEEKYNAALQENKINTNTNFEENEKLQQITNDLFSEYVKNEISIYIGQLDNFLVNHENLTLGISLTKNPKYVPLKQTSDVIYTFFYDSDLVQKDETGNQKVVAKLFKLSDYLAYGAYSENFDLVEILKVDRNTTHVSESDYKYLNEEFEISSEDFKSDKIYQIHLPELAPNNYVLLFEFDLLNSLNPYRVSEVLKIESGLDFNTLYQNNTRYPGFIYLPKYEEKEPPVEYISYVSTSDSNGIIFTAKKYEGAAKIFAKVYPQGDEDNAKWYTNVTFDENDQAVFYLLDPEINSTYVCEVSYYDSETNQIEDSTQKLTNIIPKSSLHNNFITKDTSLTLENKNSNNYLIISNVNTNVLNDDLFTDARYSFKLIDSSDNSNNLSYSTTIEKTDNTIEFYFDDDSTSFLKEHNCYFAFEVSFFIEDNCYISNLINSTDNLHITDNTSSDPLPEVTIEYDSIMTAYKVTYSNPDSTKYPITSLEICGDDCSFIKSSAFTENSATFYYPYDSSSINVTLGYKNNDGDAEINKTFDKPEEATFTKDYKELKFNSDESLYSKSNSRIEVNNSNSVNITIFYSDARLAEYTQVSGNLGIFNLVDGTKPYTFDLHLCGSSDYVNYKSFGISEISTTSTIFAANNYELLLNLFTELSGYSRYKVKLYTNYTLKNDNEIDVLNYLNNTCNLTGFECSVNVLESDYFTLN